MTYGQIFALIFMFGLGIFCTIDLVRAAFKSIEINPEPDRFFINEDGDEK